ncbi:hypothetical protein C8R47DRAFT_974995 [Mycena vitilis]|nr:hypothetical protein C8R47DRAFT_974995 [Mycena vitilis]
MCNGLPQLISRGSRIKLILDAEGRIVAILLGRPDDEDWEIVVAEAEALMEKVRRRGIKRGILQAKQRDHRRGFYYTLNDGTTKGPGAKKPGNLAHSKGYRRLLQVLILNRSMRRIMGFQSSGLARYLPKLYQFYATTMAAIFDNQPELHQLFSNSVFPAATWNVGPNVITAEHVDELNLPHGICPITSAGKYDHKKGGHLYLKQLKLVIEFPSGSTALIMSGAVDHGNTPIQTSETRYSITQYASGELFRWAAYGFQSAKSLLATPGGAAKKREFDGEPGARAAWAISLLSKVDELAADREAVFGVGK